MTYKNFALFLAGALTLFVCFNFAVWKLGAELLLTKKYDGGDLARMSYCLSSKYCRKNHVELPRRHALLNLAGNHKKVDVITMGDSFSFGYGEGKNHFYQDYIASYSDLEVANVYPYPTDDTVMGFSPLSNLILLYNSGLLDEIGPRYVLIQSVQRYCIQRFGHSYDFSRSEARDKLTKFYGDRNYDFDYLPRLGFINAGNFKLLYYNLLYKLSDRAFSKDVVIKKLKKPLFSENPEQLLFFNQDVVHAKLATPQSIALLNANLNRMAELLAQKNIKLVFMPIVDKYDLYSDAISHNQYPKGKFFEELRKLPKKYDFIDTKQILKEDLDRGEKDLFYPDDSHWSWKAPEKIFRTIRFN